MHASRQRLVQAQDEERRRLERNLHDGAQQYLVAIKVKLGLAQMLAAKSPEKAKVTIAQLKGDADEALETLRDLARGIYPPLLADKGLVVALESQARKAIVPVRVESQGVERYCAGRGVNGLLLRARGAAERAEICRRDRRDGALHADGDELRFQVIDDGAGFDLRTARRGRGLTNMADRIDALGGSCHRRPSTVQVAGDVACDGERDPAVRAASSRVAV